MNKENIQKAINVMQRVVNNGSKLNMASFQNSPNDNEIRVTEEKIHSCGSSACFSGWLAVSKEWQDFGGVQNTSNGSAGLLVNAVRSKNPDEEIPEVMYYRHSGIFTCGGAIAYFLGISISLADRIIFPEDDDNIYGKYIDDITAEDVIIVLNKVKNGALT